MKKVCLIAASLFAISFTGFAQTKTQAPQATEVKANPNQPDFKFDKEVHDFGTVTEGVKATYDFKFTNTGKEPLIITSVNASCGCTTPEWPKEPIKPGATASIKAVYDSNGRPGAFTKSITVNSNAKTPTKILTIKGNVEKGPQTTPENKQATSPIMKVN